MHRHNNPGGYHGCQYDIKSMNGFLDNLREVYDDDFVEFENYCSIYGIAARLGFPSAETAWEANPVVYGSVYPEDLHVCQVD